MKSLLAMIFLAVSMLLAAAPPSAVPREVDPDGEMHGVKFGATEAQVRARLGAPTGTFQITETRNALFYGKSHAFVFRKGRFTELMITSHLVDWELTQYMEDHPVFNEHRWTLKPGIENDMNFGDVANKVGKPNARPDHRLNYETTGASVELTFSSNVSKEGSPDQYQLMGVRIKSLNQAW